MKDMSDIIKSMMELYPDQGRKSDPMKQAMNMMWSTVLESLNSLNTMTGRGLSGKMEELDKEFKEKFSRAMEDDKGREDCYPEEFYQQMTALAEDLYGCIRDFVEKAEERYGEEEILGELDDMAELYTADYGSNSYDFERLSQAKVACKEAVKKAVSDARQNLEKGKSAAVELCTQFVERMGRDIQKFLREYKDSFDEYVSLDCEGEAESFAGSQKDAITNGRKIYAGLDVKQGLASLIEELFGGASAEILDVKKYFEDCKYDEDDEYYCYDADEAVESLDEDVRDYYEAACGKLEAGMSALYQSVLYKLASGLAENLIGLVQTGEI